MPAFQWEGKARDGTTKNGVIVAESDEAVNAMLRSQAIRNLANVLATVAVFRKDDGQAVDPLDPRVLGIFERRLRRGCRCVQAFQVAGSDRLTENAHLASAVVEIVLAGDVPTRELEKPRDAIAEDALPPVTRAERTRRVR